MKKIIFGLLALLAAQAGYSCDVCGSANASAAFFPGTLNLESQFGLSYHSLRFRSTHLPSIKPGETGLERKSTEQFHMAMLGGRYNINSRWQAVMQLPYQMVFKQDNGVNTQSHGFGDLQLGAARYFYNDSADGDIEWLGMLEYNLKLPTGRFEENQINDQVSRYMLPGTGSVDHFFRGSLQAQYDKWVMAAMGFYRVNGFSKSGLNWGDRMSISMDFGRLFFPRKTHKIYTSVGYLYEHAFPDRQHGENLNFSRFSLGLIKASAHWRKDNWALAGIYFLPVHGVLADNRVELLTRFQLQVTYYPNF